ncbi:MAG: AzlC family ABC transporter permease, partial [Micromonosporaceae bacterium]
MRSTWRTVDADILRDGAALAAAAGVVGASFGAIAVASGVPWWLASAMSVLVFAGAAQFTAVAIVAAGGGVPAAVLGGLLLNARHLPLGVAIGDVLTPGRSGAPEGQPGSDGGKPGSDGGKPGSDGGKPGSGSGKRRSGGGRPGWRWLLGSHLMTDESVAFALAQQTPRRRRMAYWTTGFALIAVWNAGVLIGAYAGQVIGDPAALGLDAAFPAALLALLLPSLRHPRARVVAAAGAGIALAGTPL